MQEGKDVDFVADGAKYSSPDTFDVIVCAEVFEHTPEWRDIVYRSHENLVKGGIFICTMAGEGRFPHSAIDEAPIREWEYYDNVGAWELNKSLMKFSESKVDKLGNDLRGWATR